MTEDQCERLIAGLEANQAAVSDLVKVVAQQAEQIGLLVQSVVLMLGEELGTPVPEEDEPQRVDLDGNPY
jgi:hypothetical protein